MSAFGHSLIGTDVRMYGCMDMNKMNVMTAGSLFD